MESKVRVEFVGDKLKVFARKDNPGSEELVAELDYKESVGLYLNVKKQVEGHLFTMVEDVLKHFKESKNQR